MKRTPNIRHAIKDIDVYLLGIKYWKDIELLGVDNIKQILQLVMKEHFDLTKLKPKKRKIIELIISKLEKLKDKIKVKKPLLINLRNDNHFEIDDKVMISDYDVFNACGRTTDPVWTKQTVVYGYRHHDGCVSVTKHIAARINHYYVLHEKSFEYLSKAAKNGDIDFLNLWLRNVREYDKVMSDEKFIKSLRESD